MLDGTRASRSASANTLDEESGQNYLILEGTDAEVHFVYYTPEMDEARS